MSEEYMLERLKTPSWLIRARNSLARGWPAILRFGQSVGSLEMS